MAVTVTQIASTLSVTKQEAVKLLQQHGIMVSHENEVLSPEDLRKLNNAIQRLKEKSLQTENSSSSQDGYSPEERAKSNMEHYFTNYKIFIDTCSLLHFASDLFWKNAIPFIHSTGNKVIIPLRAVDELRKHSSNQSKPDLAMKASETLDVLDKLIRAQLVEIRGENTDNFADNVFQVVFTKFRMTHKLLLITQDGDLAADIWNLNNSHSVKANPVYVKRINKYGFLSNFNFSQSKDRLDIREQSQDSDEELEEEESFIISKTITTIPDTALGISAIPSEGDTVIAEVDNQRKEIQLLKSVASGGEGVIYETNTPYVAKIYKKEKITKRKYEKIKLMLSKNISCEGICYPVAYIYNKHNQFVGFLMPKAKGKELQKSLFIKPLFIKNFPGWKKRDTVELCVTILEKIKYLHDRNIIMGDINPANILVVSPKEVYFVDTDSYQIEGFPCPVGTINYTAPEIQRKNFNSFLRTLGNEYFAVATLLFMIMLPGKPPYSQQGGESPIDNIIKMDFSYPFGEQSNKKTPDGPWRFIWSHLPYDIKEAFYHTFRKDGENSKEADRLSVDEWLQKFKYYLYLLDSGKFGMQDKMSEELFPTRHKKNPNVNYVNCVLCGNEAQEESCKNGICQTCLNKGEVYRCSRCGQAIVYTNYQKYIKNAKKHDICQNCYEYGKEVYTTVRCIDCGQTFDITNSEYEFYRSKGFDRPKRCKICRKNKQNYSTPRTNVSSRFSSSSTSRSTSSNSNSSSRSGSGSSSSSWCFITTAVCDYFHKPDDCYELTILRRFRDNWLLNQPDGSALVSQYYATAPYIVAKLERSSIKDIIYKELWEEYIKPCIAYIESNENQLCKEKYISMITYLKQIFEG